MIWFFYHLQKKGEEKKAILGYEVEPSGRLSSEMESEPLNKQKREHSHGSSLSLLFSQLKVDLKLGDRRACPQKDSRETHTISHTGWQKEGFSI